MPTRSSSLGNNVSTAVDREIGSQYDDVRIVAENIESVVTVADHIDNVDTVATNIVDVHAVGGSIVDVRTVAADIDNVVAIVQDIANVNAVAANVDNIDMIVAEVISNIEEITSSSANAAIATTKANEAATSATNALVSEQNAKASELAAGVSESNAAASETVAIAKATEADASAVAAHNSELAAEALLDAFNDRYLGSFEVDPTTDNDGQPLLDGALYYNTISNVLKVYDVSNTMWYTIPQVQLSSLLDVQLTSVTTGDVLAWNGSKWINTRDVILDSLQLRGGTGTQGTFSWNADEETVDLIQNGAVLQLGQEVQTHVRNATASTISSGKVVMVTGTIGASGRITVGLYDGVSEVKYILGVCTEDIAAGDDGKVTHFGKVRGVDTSAWNEGDLLYPTTNGDFTNVAPASGVRLALAIVITKHATNGTIMVRTNGVNENAYEPKNANIQTHITDTNNPHSVTKTQVGLGNVDNTADSTKNVLSATKWTTARTVTLSGDVYGSVSIDGSADVAVSVTVADDSHTHAFSNVTGKPTTASGYGIMDVYTKTEADSALSLKAPLASPALTGTPTTPTAVVGTNTTQIASTAYVKAEISNETYSKTQLNAGQLDNRYYTETELDNIIAALVHKTGNETIAGVKTFSSGIKLQNQNVSPFSGMKNYIINGNFDIWQRETSQTTNGYDSDDRWYNANTGSTKTHSRVACTDTERALFNAQYFSRTVVNSVADAGNFVTKRTGIEDVTRLAGKTVTLSFWAKADSSKNIWVEFKQMFGTGGSPSSIVTGLYGQAVSLTSTWQKKTITLTLPSIVGKTLGTDGEHTSSTEVQFWFDVGSVNLGRVPTGIQQSGTFDIAQVQLEEGSVATPFEQRPYGLELSLCQRYYESSYSNGVTAGSASTLGAKYSITTSTSTAQGFTFIEPKRVTPTVTIYSPSGTAGCAWNSADIDNGSVGSNNIGTKGVRYLNNAINNWTANSGITYHYTASAEL